MVDDKAVVKFEAANYVEKLRDRMKQSMVDLIPDDQWEALLRQEVASFFEDREEREYGGQTKRAPSAFKRALLQVLEEESKKRLREMLATPEWSSYWEGTKLAAGEQVKDLIRKHGAEIMTKWIESAVQQVVTAIQFQQQGFR
jgi:hypothetical protein